MPSMTYPRNNTPSQGDRFRILRSPLATEELNELMAGQKVSFLYRVKCNFGDTEGYRLALGEPVDTPRGRWDMVTWPAKDLERVE